MRPIQDIAYISKPNKGSDIDRTAFHSLTRTQSPLKVPAFKSFSSQATTNHTDRVHNEYSIGQSQKHEQKQALEHWKNKCRCLQKDNELLHNQIGFLNQHIQELNQEKQDLQTFCKHTLQTIAKIFMNEIINCQNSIFGALQIVASKQKIIQKSLQGLKDKVKETELHSKNVSPTFRGLKEGDQDFEELFLTKLENTKLKNRIKVLEEGIDKLAEQYLRKYQENKQYFSWNATLKDFLLPQAFLQTTLRASQIASWVPKDSVDGQDMSFSR